MTRRRPNPPRSRAARAAEAPARRLADSPLLLAALSLAAIVARGAAAAAANPAVIDVETLPNDARISAVGLGSAVGRFRTAVPSATTVHVAVSRPGFEPKRIAVTPTRFHAATTRVVLTPTRIPLLVLAEPGDALITVYRDGRPVLKGVRRAAARLPAGSYRIEAVSPVRPGSVAGREVSLDRPTRVRLHVDPPSQKARTVGVLEATGRVARLAFSADGSLLSAKLLDGPPDREIFSLATLRRVPDTGAESMPVRAFDAGAVGRTVLDESTEIRYGVDTTSGVIWAQAERSREQVLAKTTTPPALLALADGGRSIVVGSLGGRDANRNPLAAITILGRDGRALDRIDAPTCTALALSPDGRTVAIAETYDGRIRIVRLPTTRSATAAAHRQDRGRARRTRSEAR
ncbi:MAG: hypothetical protein HY876_10110 [Coriobacteriales bacterium]|nr:hypothetical protein [Coriobacteriales bacterium]